MVVDVDAMAFHGRRGRRPLEIATPAPAAPGDSPRSGGSAVPWSSERSQRRPRPISRAVRTATKTANRSGRMTRSSHVYRTPGCRPGTARSDDSVLAATLRLVEPAVGVCEQLIGRRDPREAGDAEARGEMQLA